MPQIISQHLDSLLKQIADIALQHGRDPQTIRLLAASKQQPIEKIKQLYAAGQRCFGENYVQEALPKIMALAAYPDIEWHFIGPIQTNKTRAIATHFAWVHGVDRQKLAERLHQQRPSHLPPLQVCIEVNQSGDPDKRGINLAKLPALIAIIKTLPRLQWRGLMTMVTEDYATVAQAFYTLRAQGEPVDTLSMGMSQDYAQAIAAGATVVRIGTALFGERLSHD